MKCLFHNFHICSRFAIIIIIIMDVLLPNEKIIHVIIK